MNILYISRAYGEHAGGMERLSFGFLTELQKQPDLHVTSLVHETQKGQTLFRARVSSIFFILRVLPQALFSSKGVDLVHIGDPVLSYVGWIIGKLRGIPVTVTVHGLDVSYQNSLYQLYLRLFFRSFPAYFPISEHAKNLLQGHAVSGRSIVISPGIYDNIYTERYTKEDLSRLLKKDLTNIQVLATTGRLVRRKGHAWFIEHVLPSLPTNTLYVIAGSGPEAQGISDAINESSMKDNVLMLGRISDEDQQVLLNTTDAFIQPNIFVQGDAEGFGIAPLEAALCNTMVFASDIDGISSAIHHQKNGTLLPSEDATAWIQALTSFLETSQHVSTAREYTLKTFSWDSVITKYIQIFQELIQ